MSCASAVAQTAKGIGPSHKGESVVIQGELEIPKNYEEKDKQLRERDQVIPQKANQATNPSSFGNHILQYHFADILEHSKITPIKSVKGLEESVSKTSVDSKYLTIKPKLEVNHLRAEINIESFIHARLWTEDSFHTLRSQMKLYELDNSQISIENKSNSTDNRTYLNLQKTW